MKRVLVILAFVGVYANSFSQHSISGNVSDTENRPLIGANVILEDTGYGSVTDEGGNFLLKNLPGGEYNLRISYVGYETAVVKIILNQSREVNVKLEYSTILGEEVIVKATRAGDNTPTTFSVIEKSRLSQNNLGRDLPYLLSMEPSVVTTSDAGTGVGYTGMWIRGSNIQRINVTVNGIPINDPESHGVFWVNMPDFASSVESAQLQRGVGTSTNGGGAFGATINFETDHFNREAFGELNSSAGSFNTWKNSLRFGSGLINGHWAVEGRLSKITSDGYIDRASSDLKSFFIQGGYYSAKTTLKAVVFSGKEVTYQAWNGIDSETMKNHRTFNSAGAVYDENWNITGFYDNETDNYQQDHYQLHFLQNLAPGFNMNASLHYTYGRGYYEQFYSNEFLADYPIGNQYFGLDSMDTGAGFEYFYHDTVQYADMIVRRWLENDFYGTTFSLNYTNNNIDLILGGAWNKYANAKHFGEIIWAEYTGNMNLGDTYYNNISDKTDINTYIKVNYSFFNGFNAFIDLQVRNVVYLAEGTDKSGDIISIDKKYTFFNPKAGISYNLKDVGLFYLSYAVANREPIRTDFIDAPNSIVPQPERLKDMELGIRYKSGNYFYNANVFLMNYTNQLVLTGEINDVGSPIRANVGKSVRYGVELDGGKQFNELLSFRMNILYGNTQTNFKRLEDEEIVSYNKVSLSFSPKIVSGGELIFSPFQGFSAALLGKYISRQYLDNTQNRNKSIDAYFVNDLRLAYTLKPKLIEHITFTFMINNITDREYSSNGYLWGETPYYYPQAGINFLGGIQVRF
ncbi:MAG: TonB-dependent receptor [Bacteroidales bacterium]|nr:TonB-dependent receptor [Bacteroidales bacterium]